jgi:hypothetical protein
MIRPRALGGLLLGLPHLPWPLTVTPFVGDPDAGVCGRQLKGVASPSIRDSTRSRPSRECESVACGQPREPVNPQRPRTLSPLRLSSLRPMLLAPRVKGR